MKTIGMVGGTGWISTLEYYRHINEETNRRLGGLEAARCLLYSLNYGDVDRLNRAGDPRGVYELVFQGAKVLVGGGAEGLVFCANTLHMFADELQVQIPRPIIHIAEATARHIRSRGLDRVALLGTRPTMEMDFYKAKLMAAGITTLVPEAEDDRRFIHDAINRELIKGIVLPATKDRFLAILEALRARGAQGAVLGCTEIPILLKQEDTDLPVFDTLVIHADAAVDFALEDGCSQARGKSPDP